MELDWEAVFGLALILLVIVSLLSPKRPFLASAVMVVVIVGVCVFAYKTHAGPSPKANPMAAAKTPQHQLPSAKAGTHTHDDDHDSTGSAAGTVAPTPAVLPEPLQRTLPPRSKLYRNSEDGFSRVRRLEVNNGRDMFANYKVVQPPAASLTALRRSQFQPSRRHTIHDHVTGKYEQAMTWNTKKRGNALITEQSKKSRAMFHP